MSAATTIEKRVAAKSDDAEEFAGGSMYLGSSDLELIHDGVDQTVGMRWTSLSIPPGATITVAYVQFQAKESQSEVTHLSIHGQAADDAPTFTSSASNVSSRPQTAASTSWTPAAWTRGDAGAAQRTPDLSAVLQEIVNRPGWASGHALALVVTGTGHRTAYAFDGNASAAPLLHVEYTVGGSPPTDAPPVADLAVSAAAPPRTVRADASGSTDTDATPIAGYRFTFGDGSPSVTTTSPIVTHTYAASGTYTVTVQVTDTGGNASPTVSRSITFGTATGGSGTIEKRVAASSDDAEEKPSGSVSLTSSDLELVFDGSNQVVGMRWTGLGIPNGASITAAYVQFTADESQSEVTQLTLKGQDADDAATFTSSSRNVSSRSRTSAAVDWSPSPWAAGLAGSVQRTPDLSAVIQEIVDRPGWSSGNALAIIVTGTGHRTARAFDRGASQGPLLHVEYGGGSGGSSGTDDPPTARLSVSQTSGLTVEADGSASSDDHGITSYKFTFGDGSSSVTSSSPVVTHTYSAAGSYTVTLVVTDDGGQKSSTATKSVTVSSGSSGGSSGSIAVYGGYYDTHHPSHAKTKPNPWKGSSSVVFVGVPDTPSGGWDSSALRIDNLGSSSISGVSVTVDIGSHHYALWKSQTIPAGSKLILAQTAYENFDGSDTNPAGCYGCNPRLCLTKVTSTIPVVNVTIGGKTTRYYDNDQIMNTHGVDQAGCPYTGTRNDESSNWVKFSTTKAEAQRASEQPESVEAPAPLRLEFAPPAPNPTQGIVGIHFTLPTSGAVHMSVYDVSGRLVKTYLDDRMEAGEYRGTLDLRGVRSGIYFCRLVTPAGTLNREIILTR